MFFKAIVFIWEFFYQDANHLGGHLKILFAALLLSIGVSSVADAYSHRSGRSYNSSYDGMRRCHNLRNEFVLNPVNVNAVVAMACSSLSHVENERRNMVYEDSATLFHQWATTYNSRAEIKVEGYCAIPLSSLKEGDFERHEINLLFKKTEGKNDQISIEGSIVGKSLSLKFSSNNFIDSRCSQEDRKIKRLQQISLGMGFGMQDIIDIFRSQRTGASLNLLQDENWVQGSVSSSFSGLGLQYRMGQINGRQLALAAAASSNSSELHIRSANYLEYAENTDFFRLEKDSFNHSLGFFDQDLPTNHKFSTYSIQSGAQMFGCSSIMYEGELDRPRDLDMYICRRHLENPKLKKMRRREYISEPTRAEREAARIRAEQNKVLRKLRSYLDANYGAQRRYSSRPGVYETNHSAWKQEDKARGYVVYDRSFVFNNNIVSVVEFRYDKNGNAYQVAYEVDITSL